MLAASVPSQFDSLLAAPPLFVTCFSGDVGLDKFCGDTDSGIRIMPVPVLASGGVMRKPCDEAGEMDKFCGDVSGMLPGGPTLCPLTGGECR